MNKTYHGQRLFSLTGLKAGVPDLCIPRPTGIYHGSFLEVKIIHKGGKKGTVTDRQKEWHKILEKEGYLVKVVYSLSDVYQFIVDHYPVESKKIHNINKLILHNPNVNT